jgi:outer membrane protein OmpA-like peptidoglycan-associated protein
MKPSARSILRSYLLVLLPLLAFAGVAHAQPAEDPGLSEPAPAPAKPTPPPPAPRPQTAAPAPTPPPAPRATTPPPSATTETRERVDTQVTWEGAGATVAGDDLYERVAPSTVYGPIGLYRTFTGDVGRANHFRVGINVQGFQQSSFLIAGNSSIPGDTNSRVLGNLTIDYTPWKYLELYLAVFNSVNQNTRSESPPARKDPEVILGLGDVALGVKGRLPVTPWLDLGLHLGLKLFTGVSKDTPEGAATSFASDVIASFDLRHAAATAKVPLRFHINFGYVYDNSINLLPSGQCATSTSNDACIRSRVVETFAYGIAPSRFRIAAAIDAPITLGSVGLEPFFEYHSEIAVGDGDQTIVKALLNDPSVSNDRLTNPAANFFTWGVRVRPISGLVLDAGMDIGLSSPGFQYGSPQPQWNVIVGAGFDYDAAAGPGRTKVVTKTVTREVLPVEGRVRGIVRDAKTKKPLIGALVRYVSRPLNAQLTGDDGKFLSYDLPTGPLTLEVSRDDYEAMRVETTVPANGETAVEVLLTAKPPQNGTLHVKVSDETSAPIAGAAVHVVSPTGAVVEPEPEGPGAFGVKLPAGEYALDILAEGYLSRQRMVSMQVGQQQSVDVMLRKKPATSHVALGKNEIVIKGIIHFGTNNAEIKPDGQQLLDEVADVLVKNPQIRRVRVEGHTDNRGGAEHNMELSKARAAAVVEYLNKQGIDPTRLESQGFGSTQPLVPNSTPGNRAKNRRVTFRILEGAGG